MSFRVQAQLKVGGLAFKVRIPLHGIIVTLLISVHVCAVTHGNLTTDLANITIEILITSTLEWLGMCMAFRAPSCKAYYFTQHVHNTYNNVTKYLS